MLYLTVCKLLKQKEPRENGKKKDNEESDETEFVDVIFTEKTMKSMGLCVGSLVRIWRPFTERFEPTIGRKVISCTYFCYTDDTERATPSDDFEGQGCSEENEEMDAIESFISKFGPESRLSSINEQARENTSKIFCLTSNSDHPTAAQPGGTRLKGIRKRLSAAQAQSLASSYGEEQKNQEQSHPISLQEASATFSSLAPFSLVSVFVTDALVQRAYYRSDYSRSAQDEEEPLVISNTTVSQGYDTVFFQDAKNPCLLCRMDIPFSSKYPLRFVEGSRYSISNLALVRREVFIAGKKSSRAYFSFLKSCFSFQTNDPPSLISLLQVKLTKNSESNLIHPVPSESSLTELKFSCPPVVSNFKNNILGSSSFSRKSFLLNIYSIQSFSGFGLPQFVLYARNAAMEGEGSQNFLVNIILQKTTSCGQLLRVLNSPGDNLDGPILVRDALFFDQPSSAQIFVLADEYTAIIPEKKANVSERTHLITLPLALNAIPSINEKTLQDFGIYNLSGMKVKQVSNAGKKKIRMIIQNEIEFEVEAREDLFPDLVEVGQGDSADPYSRYQGGNLSTNCFGVLLPVQAEKTMRSMVILTEKDMRGSIEFLKT